MAMRCFKRTHSRQDLVMICSHRVKLTRVKCIKIQELTCSCLEVVPSATALPPPSADDIALVGDAVSGDPGSLGVPWASE